MKKIFKKSLVICLALVMVLTGMSLVAFADESTTTPTTPTTTPAATAIDEGEFVVTGYTVYRHNSTGTVGYVSKGDVVDIELKIKFNTSSGSTVALGNLDISRVNDSFSGGEIGTITSSDTGNTKSFTVRVNNLTYKGTGQSLKIMLNSDGGVYQTIQTTITEAEEYVKDDSSSDSGSTTLDPTPAPKAIFSRNDMSSDIKSGQTITLTITVTNAGKATMQSPMLYLTPSESLLVVGGSSAYQLSDIAKGKTQSVSVQVKALKNIQSANQYLDCELAYDYYDRNNTTSSETKGRITIPAKVSSSTDTDDDETASPVPNIIVTSFDYGGSSVAAGSSFALGIRFKNTSSSIAVENLVVTVEPGATLTLNGSTNSFYFDKIKAGKSQTISVPMKAQKTLDVSAETVTVSFKYEYLDHKKRTQATAETKITVPVYQPDRFEISSPVLADYIEAGSETTITLNYVNKSKTAMSNVEATVAGDLTASTATQTIGNVEAGKNGTIAFAVAPNAAGECGYTVTVTYEDGNGDEKERVFNGTMSVQEAYIDDGGDYIDDGSGNGMDEQTSGIPWWLIVIIVVVVIIAAIVILKKRKAAKLAKKEQELWDSWDEELGAGSGASAGQDANSGQTNNDKGDK